MVNDHVRPFTKEARTKIDLAALERQMTDIPETKPQGDDAAQEKPQAPVTKPKAPEPEVTTPAIDRKDDPGVDITDEKASRIQQVVDNHTRDALAELTTLRDRADSLMHTLRDEDVNVKEVVHVYARKVAKVMKASELIGRAIDDIEKEFKPIANTTITQRS
jgi:hypothetical protein